MPGTTNFLQINPNANNQESDAAYAADSLRTGGAATNALLPSPIYNKSMYQSSTFIASLAAALVAKGYSPNDGSAVPATAVVNLTAVLVNIMTQADMAPFARLLSPIFTGVPQAPTPAPGDNSTKIATTAFVNALLAAGFVFNVGVPSGYIKFPAALGGFIIQWTRGGQQSGTLQQVFTINFPIAFPAACLSVQVSTEVEAIHNDATGSYQMIGVPTTGHVTVKCQNMFNVNTSAQFTCFVLAIGY